jgi:hypothetical protein
MIHQKKRSEDYKCGYLAKLKVPRMQTAETHEKPSSLIIDSKSQSKDSISRFYILKKGKLHMFEVI